MTLLDDAIISSSSLPQQRYKKKLAINIIGLAGTAVLLGLYAYSVIFPPPLSPDDVPEELEFSGILAKSLEVFLVIAILYIMNQDKKEFDKLITNKGFGRSDTQHLYRFFVLEFQESNIIKRRRMYD